MAKKMMKKMAGKKKMPAKTDKMPGKSGKSAMMKRLEGKEM